MSPAAAAPDDQDIDAAQARLDRMSQQAERAEQRHQKAAAKLSSTKKQLRGTTTELRRQQRLIESLRTQLASAAEAYDGTAGTAVPTGSAATLSAKVQQDTTAMMANAVLVSEDAGTQADALARSNQRVVQLTAKRTALQKRVDLQTRGAEASRGTERAAASREAKAAAKVADLEAERMAALGGPVVAYAKSQVGDAYVYGAMGEDAFDCSGLTMRAWQQAGVSLPHSSSAQYSSGPRISESELQPGDLVFYYSPISHVGIYIGNGQIAHAANPGAGVRIDDLHSMPYVGAVRPG